MEHDEICYDELFSRLIGTGCSGVEDVLDVTPCYIHDSQLTARGGTKRIAITFKDDEFQTHSLDGFFRHIDNHLTKIVWGELPCFVMVETAPFEYVLVLIWKGS